MTNLYTIKYIHSSGWDTGMVICPKCGHEWKLELECLRCGHKWVPRLPNKTPDVCPSCKSPYWNKPRQNENKGSIQE